MGHIYMLKEQQPITVHSLQSKLGKINDSLERVQAASQVIGPSNFKRRTESLIPLDITNPEDHIYAITRAGQARKKIEEKTIPTLLSLQEEAETEIEKKFQDAKGNVERLQQLHQEGYISQDEIEKANEELEKLRLPQAMPISEIQLPAETKTADKEYYSTTDIVQASGLPANLIRPRISTELKKDPSIAPVRLEGKRGNFFSREDFDKLLKATSVSKKREKSGGRKKKKLVRVPMSVPSSPQRDPEKLRQDALELVKKQLKKDLTRTIISHFEARNLKNLDNRPVPFLKNLLNSTGPDLKDLVGSVNEEDLNKFIINLFTDCLERLWNNGGDVSGIEKEIVKDIHQIKERGIEIETVIRAVYSHFHVSVPKRFKKEGKTPVNDKQSQSPAPIRKSPESNVLGNSDNVVSAKRRKWNRRKHKKPKIPQHGASLKRTVLPTIGKKAKEAEKALQAREIRTN